MPLSIYVHLPFCTQHCTYCPFAISTDLALQDEYIDALLREIDGVVRASGAPLGERRAGGAHHSIDSIYLGGGTPSSSRRR